MSTPRATARLIGPALMLSVLLAPAARAQVSRAPTPTPRVLTGPETQLLQALAADSRTSPFQFTTSMRDGRVVLGGRVGSSSYYAAAIEVAVNSGIPFTDRLVIDTAELARVPRPLPPPVAAMPYPYPLFAGPLDPFNHAISFVVNCDDQAEIDRYWNALLQGGTAEQCGWLKDRYGVSWQIIPTILGEMMAEPDRVKAKRAADAMMKMVKIDIAGLQKAVAGKAETAEPAR